MGWFAAGLILVLGVVAGTLAMIRGRVGIGRSEGTERGPRGGEGAVVHESSGEQDFDGTPGDALPPRKGVRPDRHPAPGA